MKKIISILLVAVLAFGLFGCGSSETEETASSEKIEALKADAVKEKTKEATKDKYVSPDKFPFEGTWLKEGGTACFRIYEDNTLVYEWVEMNTSITTINGKTTTNKTSSVNHEEATWYLDKDKFMFDIYAYNLVENDGVYKLVGKMSQEKMSHM